ncbi:Uncharacterised protein [Neisseria sicca]|nr:Uncharacterised protein [Neisseria sicca]
MDGRFVGKAHATGCCNGNLFLPPSGGGKVRMEGGFVGLGKIKFVQAVEPTFFRQTGEPAARSVGSTHGMKREDQIQMFGWKVVGEAHATG